MSASASIHHDDYAPQYSWQLDLDDPLFQCKIVLLNKGIGIEPKKQEDHGFEVRLYGDDAHCREQDL